MNHPSGDRREAIASHTHFFPGAALRIDFTASKNSTFEPLGLIIRFTDGTVSEAELVVSEDVGEACDQSALIVNGYATRAGTVIPRKMWSVAAHSFEDGALSLRIGRDLGLE